MKLGGKMEQLHEGEIHPIAAANLLLSMWMRNGPSVWDYTVDFYNPTGIEFNGNYYDGDTLVQYAIDLKRRGKFYSSIGVYMKVLNAQMSQHHSLPISQVRSLMKVYLCANEFNTAFQVIGTIVADMQAANAQRVNPQEYNLLFDYYKRLINFAINVIDYGKYTEILSFPQEFTVDDNYVLQRDTNDIIKDLTTMRKTIKIQFGL